MLNIYTQLRFLTALERLEHRKYWSNDHRWSKVKKIGQKMCLLRKFEYLRANFWYGVLHACRLCIMFFKFLTLRK